MKMKFSWPGIEEIIIRVICVTLLVLTGWQLITAKLKALKAEPATTNAEPTTTSTEAKNGGQN